MNDTNDMSGETSFLDIFDPGVLEKVHKSYNEYMNIGDFRINLIDYILKDVTANEHANYHKIASNLGFTKEGLDSIPEFLLANCISYNTVKLHLTNPDSVGMNHKIALYAFDMFCDMEGDEEYPHTCITEQLNELYEMFSKDSMSDGFIDSVYETLIPGYVRTFKMFAQVHGLEA